MRLTHCKDHTGRWTTTTTIWHYRRDGHRIFECFLEVVRPAEGQSGEEQEPWILQTYPPEYKDKEADRLKVVPAFVFPCPLEM